MSPTPVSMSVPTAPASYSWEATNEQVADRYRVPLDQIVRFDLNTSPRAPDFAAEVLATAAFSPGLSEYPPADYRELTLAAADYYGVPLDEIVVGAGADEILDLAAKAFLPPGGTAIVPTPSYAMFPVLTEQRGATFVAVPRLGATHGYAIDLPAIRAAARSADLVWLCSPNNPTARAEPSGTIETLLDQLAADAHLAGRRPAAVVLDEAYAEFAGTSMIAVRSAYPRLLIIRTLSKAHALAGIRVGFGIAARPTLAEVEPYRPPGPVSTISATVATRALRTPAIADAVVDDTIRERERLAGALASIGFVAEPSATNFLLVAVTSPDRAGAAAELLLRRGLVPRTYPMGHALADHLRLTVRTSAEDDRLVDALADFAREAGATEAG